MQHPDLIRKLQALVPEMDLVRTDETNEDGRNAALVILESKLIDKGVLRWQIPRTPQTTQAAVVRARDLLTLTDQDAATLVSLLTELHSKAPFSAWPLRVVDPPRRPLSALLQPQLQSLADCLHGVPYLSEVRAVADTPPPRPGQKPGAEHSRLWMQCLTLSGDTISLQWSTVLATLKLRVQGQTEHLANKRWRAWAEALGTNPERLDQLIIRLLPFMTLSAPCHVRLS